MSDAGSGSREGSQFGPYHLLRLLGRGGMGEVYEAEDTRKGRVVALKLISQEFSGNSEFRARMQREAGAAGRLTEPHVVPIHDYGEIAGKLYLEMRLIDGTGLSTVLQRSGALSPPRAVAIVRQIAAALDAAHSSGVTHRDVKPENILVTNDDFAYLVDFGIAHAVSDPGLTQTGTAMGTYNYMAPERFSSDGVTYRADIYSLGCVLVECLTGSPPYGGGTIERVIAAHLTEPPPRPSQLRPGRVPPSLDLVIARAMAKNPGDRYNSAGDLALAAHDALTEPEQHQETRILRRGDRGAAPSPAWQDGAHTMARPQPSGVIRRAPATPARPQPGPPPAIARPPDFSAPSAARATLGDKNKRWLLFGAATLGVLVVAAAVIFLVAPPSGAPTSASGQSVLPFTGLDYRLSPGAVAVDGDGNVYAASQGMYGRVLKLASGSTKPVQLPFNGLYQPQGLAVDGAGSIYVSDFNNRVAKLTAGSNDQTDLPFNGLNYPEGVAVDTAGNVYVADRGNNRVVKLTAGSNDQTDVPFEGLKHPDGVDVDPDGNVYVTDTDNNRVLKLATGSNTQSVLPFTGLSVPWGVAVDSKGDVYVTEHDKNKVAELAAGAGTSTDLPFEGLNTPLDVTVDKQGDVYVADRGNDDVVKLSKP